LKGDVCVRRPEARTPIKQLQFYFIQRFRCTTFCGRRPVKMLCEAFLRKCAECVQIFLYSKKSGPRSEHASDEALYRVLYGRYFLRRSREPWMVSGQQKRYNSNCIESYFFIHLRIFIKNPDTGVYLRIRKIINPAITKLKQPSKGKDGKIAF
jgi:hypothetical protein